MVFTEACHSLKLKAYFCLLLSILHDMMLLAYEAHEVEFILFTNVMLADTMKC